MSTPLSVDPWPALWPSLAARPHAALDTALRRLGLAEALEFPIRLKRMRHSGIQVVCTESVGFEWIGDSSQPCFREVWSLFK